MFKAAKFEVFPGFTPSTVHTDIEEGNLAIIVLEKEIPAAKLGDGSKLRSLS